jgi:hypothetical protein
VIHGPNATLLIRIHAFFRRSLLDSISLKSSGVWARSLFTLYLGGSCYQIGGPMSLKAEQLWRVATVYAKVAEDKTGVPFPQRTAFARKAKRLCMLARIAAKIEASDVVRRAQPLKSRQESFSSRPKFKKPQFKTLAERLEAARVAASIGVEEKRAGAEERSSHPFCLS